MVIAHNLMSANASRMFGINSGHLAKSIEKLSSGYRINRSADDAAGLAISEKMRAQIRGLNAASRNAQDGISLIQVAEGAMGEMHNMLHRLNELATQAANDTNTDQDRLQLQKEVKALVNEIDDSSLRTHFNTKSILCGENPRAGYEDKNGGPGKGIISFEEAGDAFGKTLADNYNISDIDKEGNVEIGMNSFDRDGDVYTMMFTDQNIIDKLSNTTFKEANLLYDVDPGNREIFSFITEAKAKDASKPYISSTAELAGLIESAYGAFANTRFYGSPGDLANSFVAIHGQDAKNASIVNEGGNYKINLQAYGDVNDPYKLNLQLGALEGQGMEVTIEHLNAKGLGITGLNVLSFDDAGASLTKIQKAIDKVSVARADLGAQQNRLEHTINNVENTAENTQASESRIRDTNMAKEMVEYAKNQILQQTTQMMIQNARRQPEMVLALLS